MTARSEEEVEVQAALDKQSGLCDCCHDPTDAEDAELWVNHEGLDPKALCVECSVAQTELRHEDITMVNVEDRHAEAPDTFEIPHLLTRLSVRVGDQAKAIFTDGTMTERMWIKVTEVTGNGTYTGTLYNYPVALPMEYGEEIQFSAANVLDARSAVDAVDAPADISNIRILCNK